MNQENQLTEQNSEETEIDLLEIFYLLRAKLVWLILAFVIGGVIAGSITHFLITPKYTATAKMCRWRTMIQNLHSRWSMNL